MIGKIKIVHPIVALLNAGKMSEYVEMNFYEWLDEEYPFGDSMGDEIEDLINEGKINLTDFAYLDKDPGESGAWIKIRTERGFELHFAKRARKKIDYLNDFHKLARKRTEGKDSQDLEKMMKEMVYLGFLTRIDASPVFVRYQRTKSQEKYLRPSEYELVDDIDFYIDTFLSLKTKNIKMHTIWNERNQDQVFYLQSRGISKERAQLMASMERCWFEVDIIGCCDEYNEQIKKPLVITP